MVLALVVFVRVNRRAPRSVIRPFLNLVQLMSVMLLFDAPYPESFRVLANILAGLNFGIEFVSPQCLGIGSNYYALFSATVGSLALIGVALMLLPLRRSGWNLRKMLHSDVGGRAFRDLFVVVLLFHPSVSGTAMLFFRCQEINGVSYLMADYSIECFDSSWWSFLPFILFVLILFSLGTPCAIARVLYARRDRLYDESGEYVKQPLDVLFASYRKEHYYYESVIMVFKLALWCSLVMFNHGFEGQLALALLVNFVQLNLHIYLVPFGGSNGKIKNALQTVTYVLTVFVNVSALMLNYLTLAQAYAILDQTDDKEVARYTHHIQLTEQVLAALTWFTICFVVVAVARRLLGKRVPRLFQRMRAGRSGSSGRQQQQPGADNDALAVAQNIERRASGGGGGGGTALNFSVSNPMTERRGGGQYSSSSSTTTTTRTATTATRATTAYYF